VTGGAGLASWAAMPWCEGCERFMNPNTLEADGTCPSCGRTVEQPRQATSDVDVAERDKAPWHFKLILALTVVYLTWRFIQMITWVVS
jgi:predicted RNA-binding Zn-ribbon protein involved in translation (DUF1610 family)